MEALVFPEAFFTPDRFEAGGFPGNRAGEGAAEIDILEGGSHRVLAEAARAELGGQERRACGPALRAPPRPDPGIA